MLRTLYHKTLALARSRYAFPALGGVAFTESFIFPIPPDVLLLPMMFARTPRNGASIAPHKRRQIWGLAAFTTLCSGAGAVAGYALGYYAWAAASPVVFALTGGEAGFARFQDAYMTYGVWVVLISAISFIPFKLATLASGALGVPLLPFIAAAFIGRGLRFFALATLVYCLGRSIITSIERYSATLSWVVLALALIAVYFILR